MTEEQAEDLLERLVDYIGLKFGLVEREIPGYRYEERDREDKLRQAIVAALSGNPPERRGF